MNEKNTSVYFSIRSRMLDFFFQIQFFVLIKKQQKTNFVIEKL